MVKDFVDVKIEIFIPQEYASEIQKALAKVGAGVIGNYDHCVAVTPVRGYFRPLEGANPFDGEVGEINDVAEYKLEVKCRCELVEDAIHAIKSVHPYEEPLINVIPLMNYLFR